MEFPNRSKHFREQVPAIGMTSVLATEAKGLTGRSRREEIDVRRELRVIQAPHILLDDSPTDASFRMPFRVQAKGFARVVVELDHGKVLEPRIVRSQCQTPTTRK